MLTTISRALALLLPCIALSACGGGSSSPVAGPALPPASCGVGSTIAEQIIGTWQRQCLNNGGGSYDIETRTFRADGSYAITTRDYSDSSCSNYTGLSITNSGSYTLGPALTTSGGLAANEIDMEIVPLGGGGTNTRYDIVRFDTSTRRLYMSTFGAYTPSGRPDTLDLAAWHVCK